MRGMWVGVTVALLCACGEKQDPAGTPADVVAGIVWTDVEPIFAANCLSCHASTLSGDERNGAPPGVNFDSCELAAANADLAATMVVSGAMPFGGPELPQDEKNLIQSWADNGAPCDDNLADQ